ncbi:ADP-ribosylglycohydrolase family protein [Spirochaeta dissipatitropha]
MNSIKNLSASQAAVLGCLVADAAGMGVHWIYSQGKLSAIAKDHAGNLEFLEPEASNYEGVPAFFAHPLRTAGEGSNYSEYIRVLFKAINTDGFSPGAYIRAFGEHFGVGGSYVGFADSPMRETVYNMTSRMKELHRSINSMKSTLPADKMSGAAHYISRYFFEYDTVGLKQTVRIPLRLQEFSRDELLEVDRIIDELSADHQALGPDDDQMPALSRGAVLPVFYSGSRLDEISEQAIRITNNNDTAVAYGIFFSRIMADMYEAVRDRGQPAMDIKSELIQSLNQHIYLLPDASKARMQEAIDSTELDYRGMAKHFGAACHVDMAVPLALHILLHTSSFSEAVQANNRASGDNCGRALVLGPLAGAMYGAGGDSGIPEDWLTRTVLVQEIRRSPAWKLLE